MNVILRRCILFGYSVLENRYEPTEKLKPMHIWHFCLKSIIINHKCDHWIDSLFELLRSTTHHVKGLFFTLKGRYITVQGITWFSWMKCSGTERWTVWCVSYKKASQLLSVTKSLCWTARLQSSCCYVVYLFTTLMEQIVLQI